MRSSERELKDLPQIEARAGYITPTPKSGGGLSAAMLAVTIACAIGAGALLTTGGQGGLGFAHVTDAFDALMRTAGWRSPEPIEVEPAATLAEIQRDIGSVATNIDALATRIDMSAKSTDSELARLKSEVGTLKTALAAPAKVAEAPAAAAPRAETADATLSAIRNDLAALKSGLDQPGTARSSDIEALAKRLERLEAALTSPQASQDITGTVPVAAPPPAPAAPAQLVSVPPAKSSGKRAMRLGAGWSASEVAGNVMITGPRGVFIAEVGAYVPGLGRVEALRQGNRLVVIGDKERHLLDFDAEPAPKRR